MILIALVAMCVGSAGTYAVTNRLRAQVADLIIARAEAQFEFAAARLNMVEEEMQEIEARAGRGSRVRSACRGDAPGG